MQICVFQDQEFRTAPDYDAGDVVRVLDANGAHWRMLSHVELETLSRDGCDLLIVPYLTGEFSERALTHMVRFHEEGGSLFFLGDLPHAKKWYPLRNMHAFRLHLTYAPDAIEVEGLTAAGLAILGELEDAAFFSGRHLPGLRVTAFPPDLTHQLIKNNSEAWPLPVVVAIERLSEKFLGSRFAHIGFNGGEPRENVDGAFRRPWTPDSGMLTREWKGCDAMVGKLIEWLEPVRVAGAIDVTPVGLEDPSASLAIRLRNLSANPVELRGVVVRDLSDGSELFSNVRMTLSPGETKSVENIQCRRSAGIHRYELKFAEGENGFAVVATGRVCPRDSIRRPELPPDPVRHPQVRLRLNGDEVPLRSIDGFGVSTYWAFQTARLNEEFKYFCRQMLDHGCQYIRVNIPWEDVESAPGEYNWSVPDQMLEFAEQENFNLLFWMFPTTRGSGLADGGVPWWVLKEPAIDRDGKKGFFPSIWSPYYREHYFAMVAEFTRRYANSAALSRFIIDFGNSDFPYNYYYYGGDSSVFDYSTYERAAFGRYLREQRVYTLDRANALFGRTFASFDEVPVPYSEEEEPWKVYLDFREWSIQEGIGEVARIVAENAPDKLPSDLPGHGMGSIADLSAFFCDAKRRHWDEEQHFDRSLVRLHNAGREWGGEAWQVGAGYREYDDALFNSLRLNATYLTIPGADLGLSGEDIARIGYIRRTIMGAERLAPEIAVIDAVSWSDFQSLAQVGTRMDQSADLLCERHRYDFSCYRLLALPADERIGGTVTGGGGGMLLPRDEAWYQLLRSSVEKGLNLLVFPGTCCVRKQSIETPPLRQVLDLMDVVYGPWRERTAKFHFSFGGGTVVGGASSVEGHGDVLLEDADGAPLLVQRKLGKGSILLAGYDTSPDSLDGECDYRRDPHLREHTLCRLAGHLGIPSRVVKTGQLNVWKELLHRDGKDFLVIYSHLAAPIRQTIQVRLSHPAARVSDLATGEAWDISSRPDGWHDVDVTLIPRTGRYLSFLM